MKSNDMVLSVHSRTTAVEFDSALRSRLILFQASGAAALGGFEDSCFLLTDRTKDGEMQLFHAPEEKPTDRFGGGKEYVLTGRSDRLEKVLVLTVCDKFPSAVLVRARYRNIGQEEINVSGWVANRYTLQPGEEAGEIPFWSFQGASYEERPDWVLPLRDGYFRKNYMGMNAPDYGGGIPLADVWRKDAGAAIGLCESGPKLVSLPVQVSDGKASLEIRSENASILQPGETLETEETFVMAHEGDFFGPMCEYRRILEGLGLRFASVNPEAYEPTWCAWGYERGFTVDQIYCALPMVKKLGFKWVCLDDGWQNEEGDCELSKEKFPAGEDGIKEFVRNVHAQGLKVQLWWIPMACDPKSRYYAEHPENVILDSAGKPRPISWWDNDYLCPALKNVREYTKQSVRKILGEWDFDGLKIDGQHLNAAPLCYNKAHHHESPADSYEAVPGFFRMVYEEAKRIKPKAPIMFCPCGTCCSVFTMPYFDMPVASDPESSWQVRSRGKVYKALMGNRVPYNGDHVELSDGGCDFASTVGVGGVINTKFTWPVGSGPVSVVSEGADYDLGPEKEELYRKWLSIYRDKKLSSGEYLGGLYTLGFNLPECHAIRRADRMYYAFFADRFSGELELRGLGNRSYEVTDYVNEKKLARLKAGENRLRAEFRVFLLLEAAPVEDD